MRAETIHVTDHAILRWKERVSKNGAINVQDIIRSVKDSRVIKKKEPLPFMLPRINGSVYTENSGTLFVLESVTIDEYRLVTVITENPNFTRRSIPKSIPDKKKKYLEVEKTEMDIPCFNCPIAERQWLIEEKRKLEIDLSSKNVTDRKYTLKSWNIIEELLTKNKPRYIEEQSRKSAKSDYSILLIELLQEVKELKNEVSSLRTLFLEEFRNPKKTGPVIPAIVER